MYKSLPFRFWALAALLLSATTAHAQDKKPRESPLDSVSGTVGGASVKIRYGSPAVKGREIWGKLVPYGQVWRSGANEATTVTFGQAVKVEGKPLAAGTYAFFTVPEKDKWTIIFSKVANQWGAYKYDMKDDALRANVFPIKATPPAERLVYLLKETGFALRWADMEVPVKVN